jgi:hypothetical protein
MIDAMCASLDLESLARDNILQAIGIVKMSLGGEDLFLALNSETKKRGFTLTCSISSPSPAPEKTQKAISFVARVRRALSK